MTSTEDESLQTLLTKRHAALHLDYSSLTSTPRREVTSSILSAEERCFTAPSMGVSGLCGGGDERTNDGEMSLCGDSSIE
jgi:hypothetical protein